MCIQEKTVFPETDNFMTIRHLTIRGTNFDIGKKLGKLMIERHGKSATQYRSNPVLTGAQHAYIQQNYPILWERIRGVAEAKKALLTIKQYYFLIPSANSKERKNTKY